MSSAQQQLVGAAGVGLVVANVWWGSQRETLSALFDSSKPATETDVYHQAAKQVGVELLGVGALVLLSGVSGKAGNACCAALAALWVLFLIQKTPASAKLPAKAGKLPVRFGDSPVPASSRPGTATKGG